MLLENLAALQAVPNKDELRSVPLKFGLSPASPNGHGLPSQILDASEKNLILIRGAVPGAVGGYIIIRPAIKKA